MRDWPQWLICLAIQLCIGKHLEPTTTTTTSLRGDGKGSASLCGHCDSLHSPHHAIVANGVAVNVGDNCVYNQCGFMWIRVLLLPHHKVIVDCEASTHFAIGCGLSAIGVSNQLGREHVDIALKCNAARRNYLCCLSLRHDARRIGSLPNAPDDG